MPPIICIVIVYIKWLREIEDCAQEEMLHFLKTKMGVGGDIQSWKIGVLVVQTGLEL